MANIFTPGGCFFKKVTCSCLDARFSRIYAAQQATATDFGTCTVPARAELALVVIGASPLMTIDPRCPRRWYVNFQVRSTMLVAVMIPLPRVSSPLYTRSKSPARGDFRPYFAHKCFSACAKFFVANY